MNSLGETAWGAATLNLHGSAVTREALLFCMQDLSSQGCFSASLVGSKFSHEAAASIRLLSGTTDSGLSQAV